jgi:hypothetical protein
VPACNTRRLSLAWRGVHSHTAFREPRSRRIGYTRSGRECGLDRISGVGHGVIFFVLRQHLTAPFRRTPAGKLAPSVRRQPFLRTG